MKKQVTKKSKTPEVTIGNQKPKPGCEYAKLVTPAEAYEAIKKLPPDQRKVFDLICINEDKGHSPELIEALWQTGLIVRYRGVVSTNAPMRRPDSPIDAMVDKACGITELDYLGKPVIGWRYDFATFGAHIAWCDVCSEEWDAMTPEEQAKIEAEMRGET